MIGKDMKQPTKRIIIAEDNGLFRSTLVQSLGDFQIVGEAEDGQQAIDLVHSTRPDLLILDLSLPKISGIQVARELRQHYPALKILVLTIYESQNYLDDSIQAGVDGYCLKDVSRGKILNAINRILDGHSCFPCECDNLADATKSSRVPAK
jgi:DNA-binding NarL/FixJ family response regulator